jgi:putative heme transporter
VVAGLRLLLRSEPFAVRAGQGLQRMLAFGCRLVRRRPPPCDVPRSLLGFRDRAAGLLATRGCRITAATAASQLALWLVLLACLRATGLSQAQVPWQTSLAAFAFVGLLTALPITPGGVGITELGLVGVLAASTGHSASAQVTAAVLLYRAVTYCPPSPSARPPTSCGGTRPRSSTPGHPSSTPAHPALARPVYTPISAPATQRMPLVSRWK